MLRDRAFREDCRICRTARVFARFARCNITSARQNVPRRQPLKSHPPSSAEQLKTWYRSGAHRMARKLKRHGWAWLGMAGQSDICQGTRPENVVSLLLVKTSRKSLHKREGTLRGLRGSALRDCASLSNGGSLVEPRRPEGTR